MHYKSEKKHSKKSKKLPKRMKGQESLLDYGQESAKDEYPYGNKISDKSPNLFSDVNKKPKRMKEADLDIDRDIDRDSTGQSGTSPRHFDSDTVMLNEKKIPRRMKPEDQYSGHYQEFPIRSEKVEKKEKQRGTSRIKTLPDNTDNLDKDHYSDNQKKYNYQRREKPVKGSSSKRRISGAWIILICLGLLTIISLLAWDVFKVSNVVINGLYEFTYTEVIAWSGIKYNQSIFLVDFDGIKNGIETQPLLEVDDIKRTLPSTITIDITERKAVAVLSSVGRTIVIDKYCNIVGISGEAIPESKIVVTGVDVKDYTLGEEILLHDEKKLEALKTLLIAFEEHGSSQYISEIDLSNIEYIMLRSSMGLKITIGGIDNIDEKCVWINTRVPEMHNNGQVTGTFHITDTNTAHYEP